MVFGSTKETCKWSNSSKYLIYLSNVKQHITYHIYLMLRTAYNISIYIYIYIYISITYLMTFHLRTQSSETKNDYPRHPGAERSGGPLLEDWVLWRIFFGFTNFHQPRFGCASSRKNMWASGWWILKITKIHGLKLRFMVCGVWELQLIVVEQLF